MKKVYMYKGGRRMYKRISDLRQSREYSSKSPVIVYELVPIHEYVNGLDAGKKQLYHIRSTIDGSDIFVTGEYDSEVFRKYPTHVIIAVLGDFIE